MALSSSVEKGITVQNPKLFRLFVSSTFSDFKKERETLQSKVFPAIKEYASQYGYTFQPIDLRWGISNEAQLSNKTAEICLNEVRECKKHIEPNFLVMLGDKYGWEPLPITIESDEFRILLSVLDVEEQAEISKWYIEDENQLPKSYFLVDRNNQNLSDDSWGVYEPRIRELLQKAAKKTDLEKDEFSQYFRSITESEIIEGVISYGPVTEFQNKLINSKLTTEEDDCQNIFGFFRDIDTYNIKDLRAHEDYFENYERAQEVKNKLKNTLSLENTLIASTRMVKPGSLECNYLDNFEKRVIDFLKSKIDTHYQKEQVKKITPVELEVVEHTKYQNLKLKNYVDIPATQSHLKRYIEENNPQPLIIFGKSGTGKSTAMARAIQAISLTSEKRIVFRFVGATANANNTRSILTSILEELDIIIPDRLVDFTEFCSYVHDEITKIKDDTVIFIDAVDQLQNSDAFIWLPKSLPGNIKIILSALSDSNYASDSVYLTFLKKRTANLHEISEFNEPVTLLKRLLLSQSRTLQPEQESYFKKNFRLSHLPLCLNVAAQEVKSWKSTVRTEDDLNSLLSDTLCKASARDMISSYLSSLSVSLHHDKWFVSKVLGYIYSAQNGLSEKELLELISTDHKFIETMAPDTWHRNVTHELPLIHWSRLFAEIEPFLKVVLEDNEVLMSFSHREFNSAIRNIDDIEFEHQSIIQAVKALIVKNKHKRFSSNRWGKLLVQLVVDLKVKYNKNDELKKTAEFIIELLSDSKFETQNWVDELLIYLEKNINYLLRSNKKMQALESSLLFYKITESLKDESLPMTLNYLSALEVLALSYNALDMFEKAKKYAKLSVFFSDKLLKKEGLSVFKNRILEYRNGVINNLTVILKKQEEMAETRDYLDDIRMYEDKLAGIFDLETNPNSTSMLGRHASLQINRALTFHENGDDKSAIALTLDALDELKKIESSNVDSLFSNDIEVQENRINAYINLTGFHSSSDRFMAAKYGDLACRHAEKLYNNVGSSALRIYVDALVITAGVYQHNFLKQMNMLTEALKLVESNYFEQQRSWTESYIRVLFCTARELHGTSQFLEEAKLINKYDAVTEERNHRAFEAQKIIEEQREGWQRLILDRENFKEIFALKDQFTPENLKTEIQIAREQASITFGGEDLSDHDIVNYHIVSHPEFKNVFVKWLVSIGMLALVCREQSQVNLAHELSLMFINCVTTVQEEPILRAIQSRVSAVYQLTNTYPKSNLFEIG